MAAHRYWRVKDLGSATTLELTELQIWSQGTHVGVTPTVNQGPASGTLAALNDLSLASAVNWTGFTTSTLIFTWDLGAGSERQIDSVKFGSFTSAGGFVTGYTLESSDDNAAWISEYASTGIVFPGNNALLEVKVDSVNPYSSQVSLLLKGNGGNGSTSVIDETGKTVTAVGSAHISTAQSMFGGSSLLLNGTTDYVSLPDRDSLRLGASDFTIEFWAYFTNYTAGGSQSLFRKQGEYELNIDSDRPVFKSGASNVFVGSWQPTNNIWYHLALVRRDTTTSLYIDGVLSISGASIDIPDAAHPLEIGTSSFGYPKFAGHLNDFSITKRAAVYGSTFKRPTSAKPYTPNRDPLWNSVVLLLTGDEAGSSSSSAISDVKGHAITVTGAVSNPVDSVFGGSSLDFTSTAFSLSIADAPELRMGAYDFCIQGWFKPTAAGPDTFFYEKGANTSDGLLLGAGTNGALFRVPGTTDLTYSGSNVLPTSAWAHIAFTRIGTSRRIFVNGALVASDTLALSNTNTGALHLGSIPSVGVAFRYTGRIDDLSITTTQGRYAAAFPKPTTAAFSIQDDTSDPFQANVSLLLHCDGTNGSTTFTDVIGHAVTANGAASLTTADKMFGTASADLSGASSYLSVAHAADLTMGTGDHTIEAYVKVATVNSGSIFYKGNYSLFFFNGNLYLQLPTGAANVLFWPATSIAGDGRFHHIAIVRRGVDFTLFVDGRQVATASSGGDATDTAALFLGREVNGGFLAGLYDEARITKGVGRYVAPFEVPSVAFSVAALPTAYPSGVSAASSVGQPLVTVPAMITASGVSASGSLGASVASSPIGGVAAASAVGSVVSSGAASVAATGVAATATLGSVAAGTQIAVSVAGVLATSATGTARAFSPVNGVAASAAVGTVHAAGFLLVYAPLLETRILVSSGPYAPTLPTLIQVTGAQYAPAIQTLINVTGAYSISIQTIINVVNPGVIAAVTSSATAWAAQVILNNVDVSSALTGEIQIDAEEGAARVAEFTLKPVAGLIDITQWVSKPIRISYLIKDSTGATTSSFPLFAGVVDVPEYDPMTRLTKFSCTDNLQMQIERMTKTQVKAALGGYWSKFVFSETADPWTYAQDLMSTQTAALDLDLNLRIRKTDWAAKPTPDFTFTEDSVIDASAQVDLVNARDLVNEVGINFDYRFERCYERRHSLEWTMAPDHLFFGLKSPEHQAIADAVTGAGYCFDMLKKNGVYYPSTLPCIPTYPNLTQTKVVLSVTPLTYSLSMPAVINVFQPTSYLKDYTWSAPGFYTEPLPNAQAVQLPSPYGVINYLADIPRFSMVRYFKLACRKRYTQTITENHFVTVKAPASIAAVGRINQQVGHSVEANYAGDYITSQWEETVSTAVKHIVSINGVAVGPAGGTVAINGSTWVESVNLSLNRYKVAAPSVPDGNINDLYYFDRDKGVNDGRTAMDVAYIAAKARAVWTILEAHRRTSVTFETTLHPLVDLPHTVKIDAGYSPYGTRQQVLVAQGKVRQVKHVLDITGGSATTEIKLAISKPIGAGVVFQTGTLLPTVKPQATVCQQLPFDYNLYIWPKNFYDDAAQVGLAPPVVPTTSFNPAAIRTKFHGWNAFLQEFTIESPGLLEDNVTEKVINLSENVNVSVPDDLLLMNA